jgi:hypothetical protein
MKKIISYIIIFGLILTISGCCSHKPDCYSESNKDLKLRWGSLIPKSGKITGYQLNYDATLLKIWKNAGNDDFIDSVIAKIDGDRYCKFLIMTRDTILKIQALSEPGDSLYFIEYADPPRNVRMRAMWNPINKTYGSSGFRLIYDSLQALVPVVQ